MKLSEVLNFIEECELRCEGEFEYLALLTSILDKGALVFLEDKKYINNLSSNVTCVICVEDICKNLHKGIGIIVSKNPKRDFFILHNSLCNYEKYIRKTLKSSFGSGCVISNSSIISCNNVVIGKNVIIEENVIIKENTVIGDNSIIRAGSIISGEGFEHKRIGNHSILSVKHLGGVIIGQNVEIQQNCCIDKAIFPWDNTIIGDYTKLDNFIHIAHADKIGKRCLFAANSTIGGSVIMGDDCWIGVGAIISNGLIIGNCSKINIGAVVTKNVESNKSVSGNFAIEHSRFIEFIKKIR